VIVDFRLPIEEAETAFASPEGAEEFSPARKNL
jgi:hypothetical protein